MIDIQHVLKLHSKHSQRAAQRHRHSDDVAQLRDRSKAQRGIDSRLRCRPSWGGRGVDRGGRQSAAADGRLKVFQANGLVAVAAVVVLGTLPSQTDREYVQHIPCILLFFAFPSSSCCCCCSLTRASQKHCPPAACPQLPKHRNAACASASVSKHGAPQTVGTKFCTQVTW